MGWLDLLRQEWLQNEALSNYITFVAGILAAVIGWAIARIITRKRPLIVRVAKMLESSLINVDSQIRDKLELTYEGRPIDGFHEVRFVIENIGDKPIQDVMLVFAIEGLGSVEFLDVVFTNVERIEEFRVFNPSKPDEETLIDSPEPNTNVMTDPLEYDPVALDPDAFAIYLPFLNPRRVYDDYLGVTMFAPTHLRVKGVVGKGPGWTTRYVDRTVYYQNLLRILEKIAVPITYVTYVTGRISNILGK